MFNLEELKIIRDTFIAYGFIHRAKNKELIQKINKLIEEKSNE